MSECFRYPSQIANCECGICTRLGVDMNTYKAPEALFTTYKVVKVDDYGNVQDLSAQDYAEFEVKHSKHAEWVNDDPKKTSWHKVCNKLLKTLLRDKDVKMFKDPVDPVRIIS